MKAIPADRRLFYQISKTFAFSAAHQLNLPYESKCNRLHGHNYSVRLILGNYHLNAQDMVKDYNDLKPFADLIDTLDHRNLNDLLGGKATTAENLARYLYDQAVLLFPYDGVTVVAVEVSETAKTLARYGYL